MRTKHKGKILIVDDDEDILLTAKIVLKQKFSHIRTVSDPHQISQMLEQEDYELVLLDMNFTAGFTSGKEGLRWLKKIRKMEAAPQVVLMTAYGEIDLAVRAMKEGAADFVLKPWDNDSLQQTIIAALDKKPAEVPLERNELPASAKPAIPAPVIIGQSAAMHSVSNIIAKVAKTDANVLILGEHGTGKELAARALHQQSLRADQAFVHVDLGAIAETLFESELFGHVKGAFTDAREDRAGRFELASGGTLFLDEIGNLSLPLQAKLLSALQSRRVTPVGSNKVTPIDIRLLCATNMPLYEMVKEKKFRQDLIYRINTVEIMLPPLRDRREDIPVLAEHYLSIYCEKYQREKMLMSAETMKRLQHYHWPGNIRELQHALERAVIMGDPNILITESNASFGLSTESLETPAYKLEEVEKAAIIKAINKNNGNMSKAAKDLGLGRTTLYRKMHKYGL